MFNKANMPWPPVNYFQLTPTKRTSTANCLIETTQVYQIMNTGLA